MADMQINDTKIVIKKNQGLTWALKALVEKQPNSILSDGKITSKEWVATMDKLIEIQQKRKASGGGATIFTGGTDKTRAGWHTSFVVHPNQEINFTAEEIKSLYTAMGVTFKAADSTQQNQAAPVEEQDNEAQTEKDSVVTVKKDSIAPVEEQSNAASAKTDSIAPVVTDNVELAQTSADSVALAANKEMLAAKTDSGLVVVRDNVPAGINTDKALVVAKSDGTAQPVKEVPAETAPAAETTKKGRFELSWKQIGNIAIDSTKNFFKGMFCDEKGFSASKTAMTVGTVAALALAAPAAAAVGLGAGTVALIGTAAKIIGTGIGLYMAGNGAVNTAKGLNKYFDSKTEEEAKANMSQAMDGAVELATSVPTLFALKGIANKTGKSAVKKAEAKAKSKSQAQPKPSEPAPTGAGTPKTAEEELIAKLFKKAPERGRTATYGDGTSLTTYKSGRRTVDIYKDADGKITSYVETKHNFLKTKRVYEERDANGKLIERTSNRYGLITKKLKVSVSELADGRVITTKVDSKGKPIVEKPKKTEQADKTENKPPEQAVGEPEVMKFSDGSCYEDYIDAQRRVIKRISKDAKGKIEYDEVVTYKSDGTKTELRTKADKSTRESQYNKDGKITKVISKDAKGKIEYDEVVTYKSDGTETRLRTKADKSTRESQYNKDGKITKVISKDAKGKIEYDQVITCKSDGTKTELRTKADKSTREWQYNKDGKITKEISKDASGKIEYDEVTTYNADGTKTELRTNADKTTTEWQYDEVGNMTKKISRNSEGNITSEE